MEAIDGVIYLARCAITAQPAVRDIIDKLDLEAVYQLASRHMIASIIGLALEGAGINTPSFKQAIAKTQQKTIVLEDEKQRVFDKLDAASIWHMALKGSVIKDWYPLFGMRESADVDILFDPSRAADVRLIMERLGFTTDIFGHGTHDVYRKEPLAKFEMHRELFGINHDKTFKTFFENVKDKLVLKGGSEYEFLPEDFYVYFLAHEYKHYSNGGTGLRSIFDTYIILRQFSSGLDWHYIKAECAKLGIQDFEVKNRSLATHLFDAELTEADQSMLAYIISSGTFGTLEHSVEHGIARHGKLGYILHRIILPLDVVKQSFPLFARHKALLPFLPFYRMYRGIRRGRAKREIEIVLRK